MSQEGRSPNSPNIVVFGQTGSGKSSLINMLAGKKIAEASSNHMGCTIIAKSYDITKENKTYTFWDTCGLNEDEEGSVSAQKAADDLVNLLKGMSVNLIVYFARGNRFLDEVQVNLHMFGQIRRVCGAKVPIVLVVTGLEQEEVMDEWWTRHERDVKRLKLFFKGHACVTTIKGRNNIYEVEYQESRDKVWKLVEKHCNPSHNIIVFGEAGSGKSSIVNMILGETVAEVSSSPIGSGAQCTFQHERYVTSIGDTLFNIYDTAGLNEGDQSQVPHWKAIRQLYTLIRTLDGVSLLVYCIRGRIKENTRENWNLFNDVLCAKQVPIIAVETGLENEDDLEGGRTTLLKMGLKKYGMVPGGVACVVSFQGKKKEYEDQYHTSQVQLRQLISQSCRKEPWSMTTDDWISQIYQKTITTRLCLFSGIRVGFAKKEGNVVDEFIEKTGMKKEELVKLKSTLLRAEKEVRKAERRNPQSTPVM